MQPPRVLTAKAARITVFRRVLMSFSPLRWMPEVAMQFTRPAGRPQGERAGGLPFVQDGGLRPWEPAARPKLSNRVPNFLSVAVPLRGGGPPALSGPPCGGAQSRRRPPP